MNGYRYVLRTFSVLGALALASWFLWAGWNVQWWSTSEHWSTAREQGLAVLHGVLMFSGIITALIDMGCDS